ncbi:hypothetical protein JOE65_001078 [Arthrobacter roseus]|nr:hypothetical protein [Arthrobacter roseus]
MSSPHSGTIGYAGSMLVVPDLRRMLRRASLQGHRRLIYFDTNLGITTDREEPVYV